MSVVFLTKEPGTKPRFVLPFSGVHRWYFSGSLGQRENKGKMEREGNIYME